MIVEGLLNHYQIIPDKKTINYAAAFALIEVLELLANNGADFSNCSLDFSRMTKTEHLAVFELLKNHSCRFDKNSKF